MVSQSKARKALSIDQVAVRLLTDVRMLYMPRDLLRGGFSLGLFHFLGL